MDAKRSVSFFGLLDIDWASMDHAYGPADAVPRILWGLVDSDPSVRLQALDDFYGAIHHQGAVFECTVACMPFLLEAALEPSVADRGDLLELLASVGGVHQGQVYTWDETVPDPYGDHVQTDEARVAIAARWPSLVGLLRDPDPAVRANTPDVLVTCPQLWPQTFRVLIEHSESEKEPAVRCAMVEAVCAIGRNEVAGFTDDALSWLVGLAKREPDPVVRLRAQCAVATLDPESIDTAAIESVAGTVHACYDSYTGPPPAAPEGPRPTATLIGAIRHEDAVAKAGVRLPEVRQFIGNLDATLEHRIGLRIELVHRLLLLPHWEVRETACRQASVLVTTWRSSDYGPLVVAVAEQVRHPYPLVAAAAVETLADVESLAAPVADVFVDLLAELRPADPVDPADEDDSGLRFQSPYETAVTALARLHHPAAVAEVKRLLERDDPPLLWSWLEDLHPRLQPMLPLLRRCLLDLSAAEDGRYQDQTRGIATAIGLLGPVAASAVPDLVNLLPTPPGPVSMPNAPNAWTLLNALGRIGPEATAALPAIRHLLSHPDPDIRHKAALTLWQIGADPEPALALIMAAFEGEDLHRQRDAAQLAAELGPLAAPAEPFLNQMLNRDHDAHWSPAEASIALWRITGRAQPTVAILLNAVEHNSVILAKAVRIFTEIGPPARDALPMLHEVLDSPQRLGQYWEGPPPIAADLAIVDACHKAIRSLGETTR